MVNYLEVLQTNNPGPLTPLLYKELSSNEYREVLHSIEQDGLRSSYGLSFEYGRRTIYSLNALLYPVRTNNLKNFSKDFFLPNVCNIARRASLIVLMVFALFDIITFPIRVLTFLPRIIYNARHEKTSLEKYLIQEGFNLHQCDRLVIEFKSSEDRVRRSGFFNLIETPQDEMWAFFPPG